jgi:hypothetical protein
MLGNWLELAKAVPVAHVARQLGCQVRPDEKSFGPCPVCQVPTRANPGRTDRRGRCAIHADGRLWCCLSNGTTGCGARGDAIALVALLVAGTLWSQGDRAVGELVHDWFVGSGLVGLGGTQTTRLAYPMAVPAQRLLRPDRLEVAQAWFHGRLVSAVPEVARYLQGRGLDPAAIDRLELARALPPDPLPRWMWFQGGTWRETGHLLVVPAWEPDPRRPGFLHMVSVHARCVRPCEDAHKAAWPSGASASGLVMAVDDDPMRDGVEQRLVTVCEGVPDFLQLALQPAGTRGALLGSWSGSAKADVAAAIPAGWRVVVITHNDAGGDQQAAAWRKEIERRGCLFLRGSMRVRGQASAA